MLKIKFVLLTMLLFWFQLGWSQMYKVNSNFVVSLDGVVQFNWEGNIRLTVYYKNNKKVFLKGLYFPGGLYINYSDTSLILNDSAELVSVFINYTEHGQFEEPEHCLEVKFPVYWLQEYYIVCDVTYCPLCKWNEGGYLYDFSGPFGNVVHSKEKIDTSKDSRDFRRKTQN